MDDSDGRVATLDAALLQQHSPLLCDAKTSLGLRHRSMLRGFEQAGRSGGFIQVHTRVLASNLTDAKQKAEDYPSRRPWRIRNELPGNSLGRRHHCHRRWTDVS